jgi:hypothetical protein
MTDQPFHWEPDPEPPTHAPPAPLSTQAAQLNPDWSWAPPEIPVPEPPTQMCPDAGVCGHYCTIECFRVNHCGPLSGVFPNNDWPQRPAAPAPVAFPPAQAVPATAPLAPEVPADDLASVPPPPLPPVPLYVIHTPYPEPPTYVWDVETSAWVGHHPLPVPNLTPRRASALNQSERAPLSLDGEDPVWDAGVSVDQEICGIEDANILTSDVAGKPGMHKLALDIDLPARLLPTTTPGHWHLYIDHEMPWDAYVRILDALAEAGVIEKGYARASKIRGYTSVRPPWLAKTENERNNGGGSG